MFDQNGYGRLQLQPDNKNGILATHFQFELRKTSVTTFFCQSVNLPGLSLTPVEQKTMFNNIPRPSGALVPENLAINFMVDENLKNWFEIYNWLQECSDERDFTKYKPPSQHLNSEGLLFIHDSNNQPRFKVNFENLFPVSLSGINFQTGQTNSTYQYCSANFRYTVFTIKEI
jgi:hypothetical protein